MVRVALLGAGLVSSYHVESLVHLPGVRIVAAADSAPFALEALSARLRAHLVPPMVSYTSVEALLTNEEIDAVLVLLPHAEHPRVVRLALEADLHVLCEKPMATDAEQARALASLARQRRRLLYVGYQIPLLAPYRYLFRKLAAGALGEVQFVEASLTYNWVDLRTPWRRQPGTGGVVWDGACHLVDLIQRVTGGIHAVRAATSGHPDGVPESLVASFHFGKQRLGTLSVAGYGPFQWRFSVIGTRGTITITDLDRIWHFPLSDYAAGPGLDPANAITVDTPIGESQTPDEVFVKALREGNLQVSNADAAVRTCEIIEAILESARRGTDIAVPSVEPQA